MCVYVIKNNIKIAANMSLVMTTCLVFIVVSMKMFSGSHSVTVMKCF